MGRPLRRREARLLQGRAALLLPRLVGRRTDAAWDRQSRQMECAAEVLSIYSRAGGSLRQQLDDGEIRRAESDGAAQAACERHQAASVPGAGDGSVFQGGEGIA